jgi:hypothetical protein
MTKNNGAASELRAEARALFAAQQGDGPGERISLATFPEAAQASEAAGTTTSDLTSWLEVRVSYLQAEVEALAQAYKWANLFANRAERRRLPDSTVTLRSVAANINMIRYLTGTPSEPSALDASDEDIDSTYLHALKALAIAKEAVGHHNNTPDAEQHAQAVLGSPIEAFLRIGQLAHLHRCRIYEDPELASELPREFEDTRDRLEIAAFREVHALLKRYPKGELRFPILLLSGPMNLSGSAE